MNQDKYDSFVESAHDQAPYHDWPGQGHDAPLQHPEAAQSGCTYRSRCELKDEFPARRKTKDERAESLAAVSLVKNDADARRAVRHSVLRACLQTGVGRHRCEA